MQLWGEPPVNGNVFHYFSRICTFTHMRLRRDDKGGLLMAAPQKKTRSTAQKALIRSALETETRFVSAKQDRKSVV